MDFKLWLESSIIWSKKVKKPNIDKVYPFILTRDHVFIGPPGKPNSPGLHADITMEFRIAGNYLRGRLHYMEIKIYDRELDLYDYIDGLAALKRAGLVSGKASVDFYNLYEKTWTRTSINDLLGDTARSIPQVRPGDIRPPEQIEDPAEREVRSWLAPYKYQKLHPDEIRRARETDPYAWRYGESRG